MSLNSTNVKTYKSRAGGLHYTDDATQVTAVSIPTRSDHSYLVVADILATEREDFDEIAGYRLMGAFKNDGGTLAIVGSVGTLFSAESVGGWAATLDTSGTDIRVRVTGAASTEIGWQVAVDILEGGDWIGNPASSSNPQYGPWNG